MEILAFSGNVVRTRMRNILARPCTRFHKSVPNYGDAKDQTGFMFHSERIVVDPEILAAGQTEAQFLENYTGLTHEDVLACLSYASNPAVATVSAWD